jgi:hypothetical protein
MMKRNLLFKSVLAAVVVLFTACEPESEVKNEVITFEDVTLGTSGYWNGSDLSGSFTSGITTYQNSYNGYSWSGFACSNQTNMDSVGYMNQYSVYDTSGVNGSEKFALIYSFDSAKCSFAEPVSIKKLMVNNSTYVYQAVKNGLDGYKNQTQMGTGDYFFVTVTGFDENGLKTSSLDIPLAEFRNGQSYVCSQWTPINLTSLGKVKSLTFHFTTSDVGEYGSNTPFYCCIDNIEYTKD